MKETNVTKTKTHSKKQEDRLLKQLPLKDRKLQQQLRQLITADLFN